MNKLLLDTSVIIDFLRRKDKDNSLLYKLSEEELSISIITHTELLAGKSIWEKKEIRDVLSTLLGGMRIIPLAENISEKAGYIRAYNQSSSLIDSIIAATAMSIDCKLVTLNTKDFKNIEGLNLYK